MSEREMQEQMMAGLLVQSALFRNALENGESGNRLARMCIDVLEAMASFGDDDPSEEGMGGTPYAIALRMGLDGYNERVVENIAITLQILSEAGLIEGPEE